MVEVSPRHVLEVGSGDGSFAECVARTLPVEIVAIDLSPRMVKLARSRGIQAHVADVQNLPFPAKRFDCVIANWMLYLAPDVDRAIGEAARVLRLGGRLVAGAVAEASFAEVRDLLGGVDPPSYSFSAENGARLLASRFRRVGRRDVEGTVVFPDWRVLREFVALSPDRVPLVDRISQFDGAFSTPNHLVIFVAEK